MISVSFMHRAPHSLAERGTGGNLIRQDQWDLAPATRLLAAGRHRVVSLEIGCCRCRNNPVPLMYIYTAFAKWTVCLELKAKKNKEIKWDGKNWVPTNTSVFFSEYSDSKIVIFRFEHMSWSSVGWQVWTLILDPLKPWLRTVAGHSERPAVRRH